MRRSSTWGGWAHRLLPIVVVATAAMPSACGDSDQDPLLPGYDELTKEEAHDLAVELGRLTWPAVAREKVLAQSVLDTAKYGGAKIPPVDYTTACPHGGSLQLKGQGSYQLWVGAPLSPSASFWASLLADGCVVEAAGTLLTIEVDPFLNTSTVAQWQSNGSSNAQISMASIPDGILEWTAEDGRRGACFPGFFYQIDVGPRRDLASTVDRMGGDMCGYTFLPPLYARVDDPPVALGPAIPFSSH